MYEEALKRLASDGKGHESNASARAPYARLAVSTETTPEASAVVDTVEHGKKRNQELVKDYMERRGVKRLYELYTASNAPAGKAEIYRFWHGRLPDYCKSGKPSATALRIRRFLEAGNPLLKKAHDRNFLPRWKIPPIDFPP